LGRVEPIAAARDHARRGCALDNPEIPMIGRFASASPARLVPLCAFLLAALAGCQDYETPTASGPSAPAFSQYPSTPMVNTLNDDGDGTCTTEYCTLRDAIAFADDTGDAEITFSVTGTITLDGEELVIEKDLTIRGPGASILAVSGNGQTRVFTIRGVYVAIHGLTITGGSATEGGGIAVFSAAYPGSLTLRDSRMAYNTASDLGGGIYVNHAQLILRSSSVVNNQVTEAWARGGGIALWYGHVNIRDSDVSYNRADLGGGLSNRAGTLTVSTSTISRNDANADGGGVYSDPGSGLTTILNSTISTNTAKYTGGGLYSHDGLTHISHSTITGNAVTKSEVDGGVAGGIMSGSEYSASGSRVDVKGSIVWGNTVGDTADDVAAGLTAQPYWSAGYNLIGAAGAGVDLETQFNATGDQTGIADARLGALDGNAPGATDTHALLAGSPAIDAGTCEDLVDETVNTDQRGVARPQGTACDIGAFELEEVAGPDFVSSCTYGVNPRSGQRQVIVSWENAVPGVTLVQLTAGRVVTKQLAPTTTGSWSTNVKEDPTYGMWGGANRKDTSVVLVPAGTTCWQ
jgi:CSLREA domain-containing protein